MNGEVEALKMSKEEAKASRDFIFCRAFSNKVETLYHIGIINLKGVIIGKTCVDCWLTIIPHLLQ